MKMSNSVFYYLSVVALFLFLKCISQFHLFSIHTFLYIACISYTFIMYRIAPFKVYVDILPPVYFPVFFLINFFPLIYGLYFFLVLCMCSKIWLDTRHSQFTLLRDGYYITKKGVVFCILYQLYYLWLKTSWNQHCYQSPKIPSCL